MLVYKIWNFRGALFYHSNQLQECDSSTPLQLTTVPTIVTAQTFCASRDTRASNLVPRAHMSWRWPKDTWALETRLSGFLWVVPTNTGIFLRALIYAEKAKLSKWFWYPKRKVGVTMHFSEIIKLQFGKKRHTLLCIALVFSIIVVWNVSRLLPLTHRGRGRERRRLSPAPPMG